MRRDIAGGGAGHWVLALVLGILALLGSGLVAPSPARAETTSPAVTVTITGITPTSPSPSGTLTVTGTVRNTSAKPMTDVQVHLWRSTDAITDTTALAEVLASSPDNPLGRRMVTVTDGNVFNVTDVGEQRSQAFPQGRTSLAAGQTAAFTVKGKLSGSTGMGLDNGVYLTGVQVRGVPSGQQNQTVGRARALVTVAPDATTASTPQTVALFNTRPSWAGGSTFSDNHLAGELRGRLAKLLTLARQPGVTLVVDPELVDELTALSKGYRVRGTAQTAATEAAHARTAQDAKAFLAALQPLLTPARAYRSLYGSPDVRAAVAQGRASAVTASATVAADNLVAKLPLAVVPADEVVDSATLDALKSVDPAVVLAANLSQQSPVQSSAGLVLARVASDAYAGGPGPAPSTTAAQVAGRLQAQQRLSANLTTVASTAAQADAELAAATWRSRTLLPARVAATRTVSAQLVAPPALGPGSTLASAIDRTRDDIVAWGELVGQRDDAKTLVGQVVPTALSTAWNGDTAGAAAWLGAVRVQRGAVLTSGKVRLSAVQNIVTSAQEQDIPVTITNDLGSPVTVRIAFDSENAQRIRIDDTGNIQVAAGDSQTVKVRVTSAANGVVGVSARLTTTTGRPIGSSQTITITATQAGRVGWIIIIASGVVLMAGTTMRIRQVQRERRVSSAAQQAAHWSTTSPGQE